MDIRHRERGRDFRRQILFGERAEELHDGFGFDRFVAGNRSKRGIPPERRTGLVFLPQPGSERADVFPRRRFIGFALGQSVQQFHGLQPAAHAGRLRRFGHFRNSRRTQTAIGIGGRETFQPQSRQRNVPAAVEFNQCLHRPLVLAAGNGSLKQQVPASAQQQSLGGQRTPHKSDRVINLRLELALGSLQRRLQSIHGFEGVTGGGFQNGKHAQAGRVARHHLKQFVDGLPGLFQLSQLNLHLGLEQQQAAAIRLLGERAINLVESRQSLLSGDEFLDFVVVVNQVIAAAELDFLFGSAGTRLIGVERHVKALICNGKRRLASKNTNRVSYQRGERLGSGKGPGQVRLEGATWEVSIRCSCLCSPFWKYHENRHCHCRPSG